MESNSQDPDIPFNSLPLFRDLTVAQMEMAQDVLHRKIVPEGHVLMSENQKGDIVYLIVHGAVRICVNRAGNDVIIGLRGPGEVLGELSVIDGTSRSATVITQTACTLYWVTRADFWTLLSEIPPLSFNLTRLMSKRVRTLTAQLEAMATLSVQGRLAREIIALSDEYGSKATSIDSPLAIEIPFRLTQGDLANMIGATRVQVNQVFCQWKKRNLIELRNNLILVRDAEIIRSLIY